MKAAAKSKLHNESEHRRQEIESYLSEAEAVMEKFRHCKTWSEIVSSYDEEEYEPVTRWFVWFVDKLDTQHVPPDLLKRIEAFCSWNESLGGFDD